MRYDNILSHILGRFCRLMKSIMWKKLTTCWPSACRPQTVVGTRSLMVEITETSPMISSSNMRFLKHHSVTSSSTNQRIVHSWSGTPLYPTPCTVFKTLPKATGSLDLWARDQPFSLLGFVINAVLSFTTTGVRLPSASGEWTPVRFSVSGQQLDNSVQKIASLTLRRFFPFSTTLQSLQKTTNTDDLPQVLTH